MDNDGKVHTNVGKVTINDNIRIDEQFYDDHR